MLHNNEIQNNNLKVINLGLYLRKIILVWRNQKKIQKSIYKN
jgi:hypothetical protein